MVFVIPDLFLVFLTSLVSLVKLPHLTNKHTQFVVKRGEMWSIARDSPKG